MKSRNLSDDWPELLEEIGQWVAADRCFIYLAQESTNVFNLAWEWCAPGIEKVGEKIPVLAPEDLPTLSDRILNSEPVLLSCLDELPESADEEKALLSNLSIKSLFSVPIVDGDEEAGGFLGVQSVREEREWDTASVTLLSAISGIITAALERQKVLLHEGRLHGFFEYASDFVGIADPENLNLLYLNPAGKRLIGIEQEESDESLTIDQITPDSVMKIKKEVIFQEISEKGTWHGEMAIQTIDGREEIPVHQMMVKIPDPASRSKFILGTIVRDLRKEKAAEKKLIDSERLLRHLIDAAPHALYLMNYETKRLEVGEEGFARLMGYTVDELRSFENGVYEPVHPDDLEAVEAQEKALAQADDDKVVPVVFRFKRKDGHWDWVEVHSKVFERNESGQPISEVGMAQVISGRRLAEEQLRRSEERIEMAVRGTNDGLWDSDLITGNDWWSNRVYEMHGLDYGEMPATYNSFVELLHPDDRERVREHLESHLKDRTDYDIEYRSRLKSGDYRWLRGRGQAIWDENGRPIRMAGSIQDIHEQKELELRLAREAEINRVIFHVTNGFAFVLDPEGYTVRWNPAAKELTGYSEEEFSQKPFWELLFPEGARQRAEMLEEFAQIKKEARYFRSMRKVWRKGGSTRTVEFGCSGIYGTDGTLLHVVLIGFDLSKHQRLQREVIRIAEQEQLRIGADLHDGLGQVLTGVSDLSEALTMRLKDPQSIRIAGKIYILVRNAISEVRRMSQGLTPASIENRGLAGSLRQLARSVEEQSGIKCLVNVDMLSEVSDLEMVTQLFRIAQEAVNNAVKHSGADTISISLIETEKESTLRIEDNGVGIDSKNGSREERGVGLTVMEYRVGLMGGILNIENRPEGGTRVECQLLVDFDRLDRLKSGKVYLYKRQTEE